MQGRDINKISTIKVAHLLVSVVDYETIQLPCKTSMSLVFDFYSICLDQDFRGRMKYGQQQGDFDEDILFFISPGQVFEIEQEDAETINRSGWVLLIHPDFLSKTALAKMIRSYEYFSYSINEALFPSGKEEEALKAVLKTLYRNTRKY